MLSLEYYIENLHIYRIFQWNVYYILVKSIAIIHNFIYSVLYIGTHELIVTIYTNMYLLSFSKYGYNIIKGILNKTISNNY